MRNVKLRFYRTLSQAPIFFPQSAPDRPPAPNLTEPCSPDPTKIGSRLQSKSVCAPLICLDLPMKPFSDEELRSCQGSCGGHRAPRESRGRWRLEVRRDPASRAGRPLQSGMAAAPQWQRCGRAPPAPHHASRTPPTAPPGAHTASCAPDDGIWNALLEWRASPTPGCEPRSR